MGGPGGCSSWAGVVWSHPESSTCYRLAICAAVATALLSLPLALAWCPLALAAPSGHDVMCHNAHNAHSAHSTYKALALGSYLACRCVREGGRHGCCGGLLCSHKLQPCSHGWHRGARGRCHHHTGRALPLWSVPPGLAGRVLLPGRLHWPAGPDTLLGKCDRHQRGYSRINSTWRAQRHFRHSAAAAAAAAAEDRR